MPLSNATNLDFATSTSQQGPAVSAIADASQAGCPTKRPRAEDDAEYVDPYRTLPPPTHLKIQLARFKNVYRVIRVPTNYTFAHLHTLVQYVFGWNNSHAHQAAVYTHVQMYSGNYRKGEIKKCGRRPPLPDDVDEPEAGYWEHFGPRDLPVYRVVKRIKNKKAKGTTFDYFDPIEIKEDSELTLGDV